MGVSVHKMPNHLPLEFVEEVRHSLAFSHAFFDAFKAKKDRVRFWRFLVLVLKRTAKTPTMDNDFSWAEIEEIVGERITQTTYWRKELIRKFKNNKGQFLKRKKFSQPTSKRSNIAHSALGRRKDIKYYELTDNFGAACGTYLEVLARDPMGLGIRGAQLDEFLNDRNKKFREIVDFIGKRYWPSWDTFLNEIAGARPNKEAFLKEIKKVATYWTMLLIVWEQFETKPNEAHNQMGLYREVLAGQREIGLREVTRCINFLARERVLIEKREKANKPTYSFNDKHEKAMRTYIAAVSNAREDLNRTFGIK